MKMFSGFRAHLRPWHLLVASNRPQRAARQRVEQLGHRRRLPPRLARRGFLHLEAVGPQQREAVGKRTIVKVDLPTTFFFISTKPM